MRRKIIKQGVGGYTIYLPKQWVEQNSLKHGQELSIEQIDGRLSIAPPGRKESSETSITVRNIDKSSIRTMITNAYRAGHDRIKVSFNQQKQFTIINDIVKTRLIGFEIIQKSQNGCVIENITEPAAEQFDMILRKFFYNIAELFDIALQKSQKGECEDVEMIEENIQKYDNFCRRVIAKRTLSLRRPEMLWAFITTIHHAQREIYHLCKETGPQNKDTRELLMGTKGVYELVWKAYLEHDTKAVEDAHTRYNTLHYEKGIELIRKTKGDSAIAAHYILCALREFYLATSPLTAYIS
jgi:phosphate uptake regulator